MRKGDIIYVKRGPYIVCRGRVIGEYEFDPTVLLDALGEPDDWSHFVRVAWESNYPEYRCLLGAEPCTVLKLDKARRRKLWRAEGMAGATTSPRPQRDAYVCLGDPERDSSKRLIAGGGRHNKWHWTINSHAKKNDAAVFYLTGPTSAFVAVGTVIGTPEKQTSGKWRGHFMAPIRLERLIPAITLAEAKKLLPDWGWLRRPIKSTKMPCGALDRLCPDGARGQNASAGGGFGDAETNKKVEKAAVEKVTEWYEGDGWRVVSRESDRVGCDLYCVRDTEELHVEVKGTSGTEERFIITEGERQRAEDDPLFWLCLVTRALSEQAEIVDYPRDELFKHFKLGPLQYRATRK